MPRRGPKPKPTALKVLKATRADRINAREPKPDGNRPSPPDHLDEAGLDEWHRIVPLLERMGVLTSVDGAALALYCDNFSRWRQAREALDRLGMVIETENEYGTVVKLNPAATVLASAQRTMIQLLAEFGCTPSSRSRVSMAEQKEDELAKFLRERKKG
jgi:P27 family predicted phage terminase small subunit